MDSKEDTVLIKMTVSEDRKQFKVEMDSTCPMTSEEIVLAIECWLRDNILEGYDTGSETH